MCSKLIRLIVLFAMLVCIPLQGLAAITMPACQIHSPKVEMHVGDQLDSMPHCDHHGSKQPSKNTSCNECTYCFLTVAQAITPSKITIEFNSDTVTFTDPVARIPDLVPSTLFHPPRSALS